MYRQGDVMLVPHSGPITGKPVPREGGAVILAHGEVTGHSHAFHERHVRMFRDTGMPMGGGLVVIKGARAHLTHQEHATIAVPPGNYRLVRQREYSPEAIRMVAD